MIWMLSKPLGTSGHQHWDPSGHLKQTYAALLRAEAAERGFDPDPRAFFRSGTNVVFSGGQTGERFVQTATSGNGAPQDTLDQVLGDELGGGSTKTDS